MLASVYHIKNYTAHSTFIYNNVEKKHLGLLTYIVLLLITKAQGNIAIVTMN